MLSDLEDLFSSFLLLSYLLRLADFSDFSAVKLYIKDPFIYAKEKENTVKHITVTRSCVAQ